MCYCQASDVLTVTTSAVPPGPCPAPCLAGKAKPKEIALQWGKLLKNVLTLLKYLDIYVNKIRVLISKEYQYCCPW